MKRSLLMAAGLMLISRPPSATNRPIRKTAVDPMVGEGDGIPPRAPASIPATTHLREGASVGGAGFLLRSGDTTVAVPGRSARKQCGPVST